MAKKNFIKAELKGRPMPWIPLLLVALGLVWLLEPYLNATIPLIPIVLVIFGAVWLYNYYKGY